MHLLVNLPYIMHFIKSVILYYRRTLLKMKGAWYIFSLFLYSHLIVSTYLRGIFAASDCIFFGVGRRIGHDINSK